MRYKRSLCILATVMTSACTTAQVFTHDIWNQKNLLSLKVSQLYYEANVGINVIPQRHSADFIYMAFGYGKPTKKNAWRKFIPENEIPDGLPKDLKTKLSRSSTDDLHAGMVAVGWNHWFNHIVGFYVQAGWGFIIDLSRGDDLTDEERAQLTNTKAKNTFIYNTVPVELGVTLNLWKHYNVQAGVTYMWKEIPLLTVGVGYSF